MIYLIKDQNLLKMQIINNKEKPKNSKLIFNAINNE